MYHTMELMRALVLLSLTPLVSPWTLSTGVDLMWPPLVKRGYFTIDSRIVGADPATFPCSQPLTGDEPRTIFPITGGQLQWNLTNSTGEHPDYYFVINIYLSQISADTSQYHNQTAYATDDLWKNFTTRVECGGEKINATELVNKALNSDFSDREVAGMNATFGMRSIAFTNDLHYVYPIPDVANIEEMYQCAYVTFVSDDTPKADFGGACISSSTSSTIRPTSTAPNSRTAVLGLPTTLSRSLNTVSQHSTTAGTATYLQPIPTASPTSASSSDTSTPTPLIGTASTSKANVSTIGIGVGVSVGVSAILFVLGYLLFRRRRKHGGTLALDFWVHGRENEEVSGKGGEKKKGKKSDKDGPDSGDSVHGEQLPAYGDVSRGVNTDVILKSTPMNGTTNG